MLRIPFRRRRETGTTAEEPAASGSPGAGEPAAPAAGKPAAPAAGVTPSSSQASAAGATPAPPQSTAAKAAGAEALDPAQRIEGLRAWIARLDRKLGVRTYVIGAIAILALAAAAVALVLLVQLKRDAATKDDVDAIQGQLSGVQQSATPRLRTRSCAPRSTLVQPKASVECAALPRASGQPPSLSPHARFDETPLWHRPAPR